MQNLTFTFEGMTPGHSLNMVMVNPIITKALKSYCTRNKCCPFSTTSAYYNFAKMRGTPATTYALSIVCDEGKGIEPIGKWVSSNIHWIFGAPGEGERDI